MDKHFNIADLFEMVAGAIPERHAIICGEHHVTYKELDEGASRLAHHLQAQGLGKDDHVGLYLYNCIEYLEAMLACFKIRAVPINVNYRYVNGELSYIFENSDMKAVVFHQEFTPTIEDLKSQDLELFNTLKHFIVVADDSNCDTSALGAINYKDAQAAQSSEADFAERSGDDLFILYTGGTTGMPKGVMWPHEAVLFAAMNGVGHFHADGPLKDPRDVVRCKDGDIIRGISLAPLMHGASWWYSCILLLSGNVLILNSNHSFDGQQIWRCIADQKVNMIQIVGDAMAIPLLDALEDVKDDLDLSAVFHVGSGGAIFSESKQQAFKDHFPNCFITNAFGSSESGQMGTDSGAKKNKAGLGNIARDEVMDVLLEEDGVYRHAKEGEMGIFARSGHIPLGYYNAPEKTAETFINVDGKRWLLTGDAAQLEKDASITIFGRGSNCINSGGEKIFPEEVEQALKAHPAIFDALVVATPHERWGSQVTAVISIRQGSELNLEEVQENARQHISGYKIPRELHIAEEVRRAPSGKPDYKWALNYALSKEGMIA